MCVCVSIEAIVVDVAVFCRLCIFFCVLILKIRFLLILYQGFIIILYDPSPVLPVTVLYKIKSTRLLRHYSRYYVHA